MAPNLLDIDADPAHLPPPPPRRRRSRAGGEGSRLFEGPNWTGVRVVTDVLLLAAALAAARAIPGTDGATGVVVLAPLVVVALALTGGYRRRLRQSVLGVLASVAGAVAAAATLTGAVLAVVDGRLPAAALVSSALLGAVAVAAGRALLVMVQRRARRRGLDVRRTLIVGAGDAGMSVAGRLRAHPEHGLRPIGFLDAAPCDARLPVLGTPEQLGDVAGATGADTVVLAFAQEPDRYPLALVRRCNELALDVMLVPELFDVVARLAAPERPAPLAHLRECLTLGGRPARSGHALRFGRLPDLEGVLERRLAARGVPAASRVEAPPRRAGTEELEPVR